MVCNVHGSDFYSIVVSLLTERLNRQNWDIGSIIKDKNFVKKFLTKLRSNTTKRCEHTDKFIIKGVNQTIYLCVFLCCTIRKANFYIARRSKAVTSLASFPFPGVNINFWIRLSNLFCKRYKKVSPLFRLLRHIDSGKELRPLIVIGAAPASNSVIAKAIGIIKINFLRQNVEPNIEILPEENRRSNRLLLNLYRFCIIFDTVIFASAHRFGFADTVKS